MLRSEPWEILGLPSRTASHICTELRDVGRRRGSGIWITLSDYWTDLAWDNRHLGIRTDSHGVIHNLDLQQVLAHELDHLNSGPAHTDSDGYDTTNSTTCGDIP